MPPNVRRALLHSQGIAPYSCGLFHSLNQRIDSKFPRSVATFHDLFVLTGEYSTPEFRKRFAAQARAAAERAGLLIAVSGFTANQIVELLGVERSRIRVIHHGVNVPGPGRGHGVRRNIILTVGALQKRKNIIRLVEAFERTPPDWKLWIAGSQGYGAEEAMLAIRASPRAHDIELLGYVTAERLETLYQQAKIFAFPSLDEGFGMPVLDAMAHGIPVIASNGSAISEVAGDAALLVDALSSEAIGEGLRVLTGDEAVRTQFVARGLTRVTKFSWDEAIAKTWAVYGELL